MEDAHGKSPPISLISSAVTTYTELRDSRVSQQNAERNPILPLSVKELYPKYPTPGASPIGHCLTSEGPLVTPDACPLLSFEDDRRVRFRDGDEEWLLTEDISVASASARCSEEASTVEAASTKPETATPRVGSGDGTGCALHTDRRRQYATVWGSVPETQSNRGVSLEHSSSLPLEGSTKVSPSGDTISCGVPRDEVLCDSAIPRHFWWPAREGDSRVDSLQSSVSDVTTPGSEVDTKRSRRHTAPGVLKTALIRSADGSLRRRPLHSPPCLTTIHPPKSCVRIHSESSLTGFHAFGSRMSIGSLASSPQSIGGHEVLPVYVPRVGVQMHAKPPRLLRTFSGPRFSSLTDSSPFGPRTRACQSHVSQPGALVDIAALEID